MRKNNQTNSNNNKLDTSNKRIDEKIRWNYWSNLKQHNNKILITTLPHEIEALIRTKQQAHRKAKKHKNSETNQDQSDYRTELKKKYKN